MKRRGFFGVMGGAAVAGPGMVKKMAAGLGSAALPASASMDQGVGYLASGWAGDTGTVKEASFIEHAARNLLKLNAITPTQRARRKRQMHFSMLDPDIASYRSISLAAKMDWQRDRMVDALIIDRKTMWQRYVDGITLGPDDDDF